MHATNATVSLLLSLMIRSPVFFSERFLMYVLCLKTCCDRYVPLPCIGGEGEGNLEFGGIGFGDKRRKP